MMMSPTTRPRLWSAPMKARWFRHQHLQIQAILVKPYLALSHVDSMQITVRIVCGVCGWVGLIIIKFFSFRSSSWAGRSAAWSAITRCPPIDTFHTMNRDTSNSVCDHSHHHPPFCEFVMPGSRRRNYCSLRQCFILLKSILEFKFFLRKNI